MTDLRFDATLSDGLVSARPRRAHAIALLYAAGLVAGGVGVSTAIGHAGEPHSIEWQLALLMRFMAGIKALMVVGALALAHWRFSKPIGSSSAMGYIVGIALMALAPGLIWSMDHVVLGAACFHAGLLTYLVLAWRDDAVRRPTARR